MENEKELIIGWSESNRDDHKAKHGVDFLDASFMFRKDTLTHWSSQTIRRRGSPDAVPRRS